MPSKTKICVVCGQEFTPHRPCCVCCSRQCSQINFRRMRGSRYSQERPCSECGTMFTGHSAKRTCSPACAKLRDEKQKAAKRNARRLATEVTDAELDARALVDLERLRSGGTYRPQRVAMTDMLRSAREERVG